MTFDLQAREYNYNKSLVKDDIVNKAIIYGKNGVGKSNLGIALFDIVQHLTDKERMPSVYTHNYINLASGKPYAVFTFHFQFDDDEVIYEYSKKDANNLVSEKLTVNSKTVIDYSFFDQNRKFVDASLLGSVNINLPDNKLSVVKYIYRNTPTNYFPPLSKMVKFCENMLWYRSLSDGNSYCGYTNGRSLLIEKLYENGNLDDFSKFLSQNGIDYQMEFRPVNSTQELFVCFGTNYTPFTSIASTGTMALLLFYVWSITAFEDLSFLFIDEFDAFFHYESAENIVLRLNKARSFQTLLTTHNTYLMQNRLTRPDCCFIMTGNKITNLSDSTEKEIREAHNLEKMYINGAFNE